MKDTPNNISREDSVLIEEMLENKEAEIDSIEYIEATKNDTN